MRSWPATFTTAPARREVALEDHQATRRLQRLVHREDHVLARRLHGRRRLLGDRASGDRHHVAVQLARLEEPLREQRRATRAVHVERHVAASGAQVADKRRVLR